MRYLKLLKRPVSFTSNFLRSDEPWSIRFLNTADRLLARLEGRRACCGHYGEPGC